MGTMLQQAGLPAGRAPEAWNLEAPERVARVHAAYLEAGSQLIYANTFGANREKLLREGLDTGETVRAGLACARQAVDAFCAAHPGCARPRVALDIGPSAACSSRMARWPLRRLTTSSARSLRPARRPTSSSLRL